LILLPRDGQAMKEGSVVSGQETKGGLGRIAVSHTLMYKYMDVHDHAYINIHDYTHHHLICIL